MALIRKLLTDFKNDSLSRNAIILMLSTFIMAGIGFFFWSFCARLFTAEQIGLATTLISMTNLLSGLSLVGLNTALVRFLPTVSNKTQLINSAIGCVIIASIVITTLFHLGLPLFSPNLAFLQKYPLFDVSLIVFIIILSINNLTDSVFLSFRKTEFTLGINTIMSLVKLALPLFLVGMGAYGIFYSFMISVQVAFVLSIISLTLFFHFRLLPVIRISDIQRVWRFTAGNYLSSILGMLPSNITPLIITSTLGPTVTAYYYMPNMIIQMLLAIPRSTSSSFYSEASNSNNSVRTLFVRTLKTAYILLIPLSLLIIIFGKYILLIFGKNYSDEGYTYLVLFLIAMNIAIPSYLIGQILNLQHKMKHLMMMSIISTIVSIGTLIIFVKYGINGIGIASVTAAVINLLVSVLLIFIP